MLAAFDTAQLQTRERARRTRTKPALRTRA
jgi:hypothetical protein